MIPERIIFLSLSLFLLLSCLSTYCNCSIFPNSQIVSTVCECAEINELVEAIDVANTNNEAISLSRNCDEYFTISSIIAGNLIRVRVKYADTLDYENQKNFDCTVSAIGSDGSESYAQLDIFISDCNDNPPVLSSSILSATVSETSTVGEPVFTVEATDEDSGTNGALSFFIQDISGKFEINEITGVITLASSVDFETQSNYDLIVTVTDNGDPLSLNCPSSPLSTDDTISILVSDSPDTPPIFTDNCCQFSVEECAPIDTSIGTFMAYDGDTGVGDDIEFSFLSSNPSCFSLATNGLLTVSTENCIDRESSVTYTLSILATEVNQPKHNIRADFDIEIIDCNDVVPQMVSLPNNFSVNEGLIADSTLFSIQTFDGDQVNTDNSRTFVTILPEGNIDGIFAINEHSTALISTQLLDRETHPDGFQLTLVASDYGNPVLTSSQSILISLNDINDNPPTFSLTTYSETVTENLPPNECVLQLIATDDDIGINAEFSFNIISGNDAMYFSLDHVTGDIMTTDTMIDRETYTNVDLVVSVIDSGANPLQTTASVSILISDENDNIPIFSHLFYEYSVEEEQNPSDISLEVIATDLDDEHTGNGIVSYSIISGNDEVFYLDNNIIKTTVKFDREITDSYQLVIQASDNGTLALSSTASVSIIIADTNDNFPIFTRNKYIVGFSENSEFETKIIQFVVTDEDIPPHNLIRFELTRLIQAFDFSYQTGILVTDQLFRGRAGEHFEFTITAYDNNKEEVFNSVSQPVTVIVIKDSQRLIALLDSPIEEVSSMETRVREVLEDITHGYVNIEEFLPATTDNQVDSSQTRVVFHVIDLDTEWIADPEDVLKGADERFDNAIRLYDTFSVVSISPYPETVSSPYILPALISTVSVLALFLCLTCCCCCLLCIYIKYFKKHARKKFERDLDDAGNLLTQQHAKSFSSLSAVGTSGLFAQSNAAVMDNPLWVHPYDNMGSLYSTESTLYETKELIIDLFAEDLDDYSLYSAPSKVNVSLLQGQFDMPSSDSASTVETDDMDYLPNSESDVSNFDFPSTSSSQKMALDVISEDSDVISII
ncbi:Protocadherin Fat 4 [Oopsacas minuta]|uniref:Protocadherin Fat 4 n=1 Tax=Oopsacas minuta TaxID=111878 RepID=A0AAV7K0I2_9METZ|nr:Protocadherin Fat 4 [Oopsacas minuta]